MCRQTKSLPPGIRDLLRDFTSKSILKQPVRSVFFRKILAAQKRS